jgi:hypothetical protein
LAFEVGILGEVSPLWYRVVGTLGYPQHRWFYSERSLQTLLAKADLRVERIRCFGLLPSVLVHYTRTILVRGVRRLFRAQSTRRGNSSAQEQVSSPARSAFRCINARVDNFFRYGIGRFAPPVGPNTLFVTARPNRGTDNRPSPPASGF